MTEAIAILFRCNPDKPGDVNYDVFRQSESTYDPVRVAEMLRDSCSSDFPGSLWGIAVNERARELMSARRLRDWGMTIE